MTFEHLQSLTKEQLVALRDENKGLYYSTKQQANYTSDVVDVLNLWSRCDDYWAIAQQCDNLLKTK